MTKQVTEEMANLTRVLGLERAQNYIEKAKDPSNKTVLITAKERALLWPRAPKTVSLSK